MADLIERLRLESAALQKSAWGRNDGGQECCLASALADEAATTIESLQSQVEELRGALGWQDISTAPKDGSIFYTAVAIKWVPYKPSSEQRKRGIMGRWMESNGYGGWTPCKNGEPAQWVARQALERSKRI
jgi:hypothetical protein